MMRDELLQKKVDIEKTIKKVEYELNKQSSSEYKIRKELEDYYNDDNPKQITIQKINDKTFGIEIFWGYIGGGVFEKLKKIGYKIIYVETKVPKFGHSLFFQVSED